MKIMAIAHERDLNGASISLIDLIDSLSSRHEFWVVTAFNDGEFYDAIITRNVHVIVIPFTWWMRVRMAGRDAYLQWLKQKLRWYLKENKKNEQVAEYLSEIIEKNDIDLIYTNTRVIDIGMRCAKLTGKPHIWHIREFGEEDFSIYPFASYRKHYSMIKKNSQYVIYNSEAVKRKYEKYNFNNQIVIYNGIKKSDVEFTHNKDKVIFLISGRISEAKGQVDVLKAVEILIKKGNSDFEVWMAGTEDLYYEEFYSRLKKVEDKVRVLGKRTDMGRLRYESDVELVCSRREAFGRVTIEAMMAGNPVIGSNTGGTVELIKEGENGFLYEWNNPESLAEKMLYFLENKEKLNDMGEFAKSYAENKFSIENCTQSIERVFELCAHVGSERK